MENKQLAAVLGSKNWDDLNREISSIGSVELLSPIHNMEDLERTAARGLLDVVFIDVEEYLRTPSNGTVASLDRKGLYVVFISDGMNPDGVRAAMRAGARDFIARPFSNSELMEVFERAGAHQPAPHVEPLPASPVSSREAETVTFFTTKGGAGKSTLATNLAVALASRCGARVCLADFSLQFGDLSLILNVKPRATIADIARKENQADDVISCLSKYDDLVYLLPAPAKPEEADLVTSSHVNAVFDALSPEFDFVISDTAATFNDVSLSVLDRSSQIFIVVTPIILGVKNLVATLEVMRKSLGYPEEKIKIVLNRSDSKSGISAADIEKLIKRKIDFFVPSDGNVVAPSLNHGIPAVVECPRSKFSKSVLKMAEALAGDPDESDKPTGLRAAIARLFGR